jgi:hypothetical protein
MAASSVIATQPNKALQLTARQHASRVTSFYQLNADRAPQLKASVLPPIELVYARTSQDKISNHSARLVRV